MHAQHDNAELRNMYLDIPSKGLLSDEMSRNLVHGYYASVSYMDALIGDLIDGLDAMGLRDNTTIILWSDHGFFLGEHGFWCKHSTFYEAIKIPFIISSPDYKKNAVTESFTELIDVFPTLCDLVDVETPNGLVTAKEEDHFVRGTSDESLASLRTHFGPTSLVTAGNASGVVDGAAAVVLKSASQAASDGDTPLAKIVNWGIVGLEPAIMAYGPVPASKLALERAGMSVEEIDLWEINEAFAGQAVACMKELGISHEIVNINGGAVGLGHPLAATGSRLTLTLAHTLKREGKKFGIATACIGGGQGIAIILESV